MAFNIHDWRGTRQFTDKLPDMLGVSDGEVTPKGLIYFNEHGILSGYIEEMGPTFYCASIGGEMEYRHGDEGLHELEDLVYQQLLLPTE